MSDAVMFGVRECQASRTRLVVLSAEVPTGTASVSEVPVEAMEQGGGMIKQIRRFFDVNQRDSWSIVWTRPAPKPWVPPFASLSSFGEFLANDPPFGEFLANMDVFRRFRPK